METGHASSGCPGQRPPPKSNNSRRRRFNNNNKQKKKTAAATTTSQQNNEQNDADNTTRRPRDTDYKNSNKKKGSRGFQKSSSNDSITSNNQNNNKTNTPIVYPPHWNLSECLKRYNDKDPNLIRGTIRVLPSSSNDPTSFCTCDRGSQLKDVLIQGPLEKNRAIDGDTVFVELLPIIIQDDEKEDNDNDNKTDEKKTPSETQEQLQEEEEESIAGDVVLESWWQDDPIQMNLWNPIVPITRNSSISRVSSTNHNNRDSTIIQRRGRVVHVVPPKAFGSEINPTLQHPKTLSYRSIVGTLKRLSKNGTTLLTPANKSLGQFRLSNDVATKFKDCSEEVLFQAKYKYGSWQPNLKWPPCIDVVPLGMSCNVQDETMALLIANQVDHGDFSPQVLEECQQVVASGEYQQDDSLSGWKPTREMHHGRRDYRHRRIFTIDPTTAKDLDDALHIEVLDNGQIEIGVHIADVSYFVQPHSNIDLEASQRCTTVYLVDRTFPMLPRPLCEIACSLNENVERLAFSCVWKMNRDGSLVKGEKVWYGRTVIKSCAKLDYATAQNIIDKKVAIGENSIDEELWPRHRQPTCGHTIEQVAADVRLMNEVAQARRRLRFQNGAVALNAVKLTFQLDLDGETPLLCKPYPIRDSNRLVEEYMLLANYLVAQRLITHAGGRALLRNHVPPVFEGLEKVAILAKEALGFRIDIDSSEGLQRSLNRISRECQDELVLQCITEMLKLPMRAATYFGAGTLPNEAWAHFALNIPYYTHFTSPIRRYADVIVHRLLQATLEGEEAVEEFSLSVKDIESICQRCNDKKEGSRNAQERSDVVFLALYLKRSPLKSQMGIVLSVGIKTFTVFVPSLGVAPKLFLDEHESWIKSTSCEVNHGMERRIKLQRTSNSPQNNSHNGEDEWNEMVIKFFTKVRVTCCCRDKPPINVRLELEGPWLED